MSEKSLDRKGRWRSKTVAFRLSPEENETLNNMVKLSGQTKQDYIIQCVLEHNVTIYGNPRVFKAVKEQLNNLLHTLHGITHIEEADDTTMETLARLVRICEGMMLTDRNKEV